MMAMPTLEPAVTSEAKSPLVLILEDDVRSADALAMLLADWGYECLQGETLEAVLPIVRDRAGEFRAVISDYHLASGTTGVDAAKAMKALGVAAPVLLLTGTLRGQARRTAADAGYRFMEKPAPPEHLKAWLQQVVVDLPV
jgi:DNA-binding NtrC family response regulator